MSWYLAIRRMNHPFSDWRDRLAGHLTWLRAQHERGSILISGPSADLTLGLYVMRAASYQDAATIAASDPLAQDGLASVDIIDWQVHQVLGLGSFSPDEIPGLQPVRQFTGNWRARLTGACEPGLSSSTRNIVFTLWSPCGCGPREATASRPVAVTGLARD